MVLATMVALFGNVQGVVEAWGRVAQAGYRWGTIGFMAVFMFSLLMLGVMAPFVISSFRAYLHNYTYLEELLQADLSRYDRGFPSNHAQVFGPSRWLDPLPFHGKAGLPGDGFRWDTPDLQCSFCLEGLN
jgi:hypothetical protein